MIPYPTFNYEQQLWQQGYEYVLGIDEVGRGAFAGPVVAAAVVFAPNFSSKDPLFSIIHDSKLLLPNKRILLSSFIQTACVTFAIAEIGIKEINLLGIGKATTLVMQKAVESIMYQVASKKRKNSYYLLVDGLRIKNLPGGLKRQLAIIKGDQKSISIAAASIIAKVYRDTLMEKLHLSYQQYNFFGNKGYGTLFHRNALKQYGLCPQHRTSFALNKFL